MRVITGSARGCRLETLSGSATRPTAERVKEGLFSAIQFDIAGRAALDLFAGSGQLGIEAISRGAASCVFVDHSAEATAVIRHNLQKCGLFQQAQVLTTAAEAFLSRTRETYDLIFLDPPYASGLLIPCLEAAAKRLSPGGLIVCESDEGQTMPKAVGDCRLCRSYRYGRVHITTYRPSV